MCIFQVVECNAVQIQDTGAAVSLHSFLVVKMRQSTCDITSIGCLLVLLGFDQLVDLLAVIL